MFNPFNVYFIRLFYHLIGEAVLKFVQAILLSPRALFFIVPSPFLSPRALFCHPEASAEGSLGACALWEDRVRRFLASLEMTEKGGHPEPPFLSPRGVSRGVPRRLRTLGRQGEEISRFARNDRVGFVAPSLSFFVTPRRKPRGPFMKRQPWGLFMKRHPERSEGPPRHYRGRGITGCGDFSLRSK